MGFGMILTSFFTALGQMFDVRFLRVLLLGLVLTLALLAGVYAVFVGAIQMLVPDRIELPWIGPVGGLDTLLSVASFFVMILLSVFLMVPVASAFAGLFLEDVAAAVEAQHYPGLPPARRVPFGEALIDTLNFLGVIVLVNMIALVLMLFVGPLIPLVFWAVNGFLLGREYFQLVAMRRMSRPEAKALRARHFGTIWLAGVLMAAPLSIPFVNLLVPVLGVATFTHLFHRLAEAGSASRNPAR
jgi:uncharacterized protein involved in cysteine biosynthesis